MTSKKRGLGKGLSALIQDKEKVDTLISDSTINPDESVVSLPLANIKPKPDQPRKIFQEDALEDLAQSIRENGVIQPIIVRKSEDEHEIIAGERRWRAAKEAGLEEIPCIVRDIDNITADRISLIENIQRENLNPIEEAQAYKRIMKEYNLKQEELAKAVGKSRSYISNNMRLLNLDEKVVQYIYEGKISGGHGKALLGIKTKDEQLKAAERIIQFGLNVRDTESNVKKKKKTRSKKKKENYIVDLEEQLMSVLGTKVTLNAGRKSGKIEIEYYNDDDLERLIDLITG
ncbi:ParB/RepB/Spo0J family partition protein [Gudongella sp. DL1XJH-153]|uniref:ParB/RepB/Spo0J family partition protein n=1 Tax=Gudongella sp. DL1XJH-153 TaxID=3409804 RepID=UPI003BB757A0